MKTHISTFNQVLYGGFVLMAVYFTAQGDYSTAASNLGISLIFDPFEQSGSWNERALWQRVWLIVHLVVLFSLFGVVVIT